MKKLFIPFVGPKPPCYKDGKPCPNSGTLHERCAEYKEFERQRREAYKRNKQHSDLYSMDKEKITRNIKRRHLKGE